MLCEQAKTGEYGVQIKYLRCFGFKFNKINRLYDSADKFLVTRGDKAWLVFKRRVLCKIFSRMPAVHICIKAWAGMVY